MDILGDIDLGLSIEFLLGLLGLVDIMLCEKIKKDIYYNRSETPLKKNYLKNPGIIYTHSQQIKSDILILFPVPETSESTTKCFCSNKTDACVNSWNG